MITAYFMIDSSNLIFTKPPKIKDILENKIDLMIEDSPTAIGELVEVVKVLYYDTRYNRDIEHENIRQVRLDNHYFLCYYIAK